MKVPNNLCISCEYTSCLGLSLADGFDLQSCFGIMHLSITSYIVVDKLVRIFHIAMRPDYTPCIVKFGECAVVADGSLSMLCTHSESVSVQ